MAAGRGTVYSGTKFAVKAISEGLRAEVAKDNIRVTTLYPGAVESELKYGSSDPEASANIQAFYKECRSWRPRLARSGRSDAHIAGRN